MYSFLPQLLKLKIKKKKIQIMKPYWSECYRLQIKDDGMIKKWMVCLPSTLPCTWWNRNNRITITTFTGKHLAMLRRYCESPFLEQEVWSCSQEELPCFRSLYLPLARLFLGKHALLWWLSLLVSSSWKIWKLLYSWECQNLFQSWLLIFLAIQFPQQKAARPFLKYQ